MRGTTYDTQEGFGDGQKHGWLNQMCGYLTDIRRGRYAQAYLNGDHGALPARGAVVSMPMWVWKPSAGKVGRKSRSANGGELLLPVRVSWEPGALTVIGTGERSELEWTAAGLGATGTGQTVVEVVAPALSDQPCAIADGQLPETLKIASQHQRMIRRQLTKIVEAGHASQWQATMNLQPYVEQEVRAAAARIGHEIAGNGQPAVILLDGTSMEAVIDTVMLGSDDRVGAITRLLEKCLVPGTFVHVDPMKYIRGAIRRDSEEAVRVAVGEPRVGAKVRRHYRIHHPKTVEALIEGYRKEYPADRLAINRAEKSLLPSLDPMAHLTHVSTDDSDHAPIDVNFSQPCTAPSVDELIDAENELHCLLRDRRYQKQVNEVAVEHPDLITDSGTVNLYLLADYYSQAHPKDRLGVALRTFAEAHRASG